MPAGVDKLGVVAAALLGLGAAAPFALYRANRIATGEARGVLDAVPTGPALGFLALLAAVAVLAALRTRPWIRLAAASLLLVAAALLVGATADHLTPPGDRYARVSPGSGFWILLFAGGLLLADAIVRLRLRPLLRVAALALTAAVLGLALHAGLWSGLSILKEYANRADVFWREATTHLLLALGSLAAAAAVGLPLGILLARAAPLRAPVLNVLNMVQTIPSIALFGMLIAPLGWVAAHVPGAAALGIRGIGTAPAFVALFLYSLLPVVANTVVGLRGVPAAAVEAARGMGMTVGQRLVAVDLPLALPVILTGIRIVLVQNIGLATVAALIGGGGFGVFVFLGIGQTAPDLILLGAVPTVLLAFAAAVVLDAAVEGASGGRP
ncbi:ABC transporter permease [Prosthecomicrobium sp. N25]|uniref:ABC transporter permease n=1 Tax=Prosthecomicrobium sp. N25 TaxID=3129254 RepID=UPI0030786DAA